MEDGDITVTAGDSSQSVSQGSRQETYTPQQEEPVITQRDPGVATENTVTITGGGTANVTIENINIKSDSGSGIDVQGTTTANINVEGTNSVIAVQRKDAAIHVSEGSLNLNTTEGSSLSAGQLDNQNHGAGIGSGVLGNMTGTITTGSGSVNASTIGGAAIGSGLDGHMNGTINLGSGPVTGYSEVGARYPHFVKYDLCKQ